MSAIVTLPDFPSDGSIKTLGGHVVDWCEEWLPHPSGRAGSKIRFTREQVNFILWFYSLDELGRWRHRRAVYRRAKGAGKSPFMGALCLAELVGPVRFDGWDANGEPRAKAVDNPLIVVAGFSQAQSENTLKSVRAMAVEGYSDYEQARFVDYYRIDVGKTRIIALENEGEITSATASAATQEGAPLTFAVEDEIHHWTVSNNGTELSDVIGRNLLKGAGHGAHGIQTTNAHGPGDESVGERSYLEHLAQQENRTRRKELLYDSREAAAAIDLADEDALRAGLLDAYGDSAAWMDIDAVISGIYSPSMSPENARRFFLNQIVAAAESWVSPAEWDRNRNPELPPLEPGEQITLGFDGALTDDSTALVAVRIIDGAPFIMGLWEKPEGPAGVGWEVDKSIVRDTVDHVFAHYEVIAYFADVAYWEPDVEAWREEYGEKLLLKATTKHAIAYRMDGHPQDITHAAEGMHRAILDNDLPHNGDSRLTRHVLNARRRPNRHGVTFGKETRESPRKVDAVAAMMLARMARDRVLGEGVLRKKKRPGKLYTF